VSPMKNTIEVQQEVRMLHLDPDEFTEIIVQQAKFQVRPFIEIIERAYLVDPRRTHADLVYIGLHDIASRLKIEHDSGRLRQNIEASRGLPPTYVRIDKCHGTD